MIMQEVPPHIRGLIFDCDGTIADTMPLHYQSWVACFRKYGREFPEKTFYEFAGMPTTKIIEIFNEKHGYGIPVAEAALYKEELFETSLHEVVPIEPVVQLVRKYHGILPMAVASGGTLSIVRKTLQAIGLENSFVTVVTADDVKHGKPAPDIFLEAARRLSLPPRLCCAFEDGDLGLLSAQAAGMMVVDIRPLR
jgi:HAD superfamily hydrolase (TIGR01509 family)